MVISSRCESAMRLHRVATSARAPCVGAQSDITTAWAWWKIMPWTKATSAGVKSCAGAEADCAGRRAVIMPAATAASANCGAAEIRLESDIVAMGCADGLAPRAIPPRTVRTILAVRCAGECLRWRWQRATRIGARRGRIHARHHRVFAYFVGKNSLMV